MGKISKPIVRTGVAYKRGKQGTEKVKNRNKSKKEA